MKDYRIICSSLYFYTFLSAKTMSIFNYLNIAGYRKLKNVGRIYHWQVTCANFGRKSGNLPLNQHSNLKRLMRLFFFLHSDWRKFEIYCPQMAQTVLLIVHHSWGKIIWDYLSSNDWNCTLSNRFRETFEICSHQIDKSKILIVHHRSRKFLK